MEKPPIPLSAELPAKVLAEIRQGRDAASFNWVSSLYEKHSDEELCVAAFVVSTELYGIRGNDQKTAFYNGMLVAIEVVDQLLDSTERDTTTVKHIDTMLHESKTMAERNYPRSQSQQNQAMGDNMRGYGVIGLQDMVAFVPILYDMRTRQYLAAGPEIFSHVEDGFGIIMASASIVLGMNSL